jgi:hypothetical protein
VVNSRHSTFRPSHIAIIIIIIILVCVSSSAQHGPSTPGSSDIQDNSFLVEEAYNQNFGVVQHISSFTRFWNSKDWNCTFTQEWPVPRNERHQLSYTLAALHVGAFPGSGAGFGDVIFNYRYQLVGSGDTSVAFSPRFSLIFPSGDPSLGRGAGSFGLQTSLPLSVVLKRNWSAIGMSEPHSFPALRTPRATARRALATTLARVLSGWCTNGST